MMGVVDNERSGTNRGKKLTIFDKKRVWFGSMPWWYVLHDVVSLWPSYSVAIVYRPLQVLSDLNTAAGELGLGPRPLHVTMEEGELELNVKDGLAGETDSFLLRSHSCRCYRCCRVLGTAACSHLQTQQQRQQRQQNFRIVTT